jgi:enoyl-CoA hydratase
MLEITLAGRGPNTMSSSMLEELERTLDGAGDRPIAITGAGAAFSAGLDLDALARADPGQVARLLETMERAVRKLFLHPAPTCAIVNGHAVAGGCLLVQCCDLRVATDDPATRIGMTGVAIGLVYPPFVTSIFRHRVPAPHLETVLLGSERYDPAAAIELGLLDALAAPDALRSVALARLEARAKLPRTPYAATKRALRAHAFEASDRASKQFEQEILPSWTAALGSRVSE